MRDDKQSYKLDQWDRDEIVRRYRSGESLSSLARSFHVYPNAIRNVITQAEVEPILLQEKHELSDYYFQVLEWATRPFSVSVLDERVSTTAIAVLTAWGYLRPIALKAGRHQLYETTEDGASLLERRNVTQVARS